MRKKLLSVQSEVISPMQNVTERFNVLDQSHTFGLDKNHPMTVESGNIC